MVINLFSIPNVLRAPIKAMAQQVMLVPKIKCGNPK